MPWPQQSPKPAAPRDYMIEREPLPNLHGASCSGCGRAPAVVMVAFRAVTPSGYLATEWQRRYCQVCGENAYQDARKVAQSKLYGKAS